MTDQPQSADWVGWRQLLRLGEQLMGAPTIAAQCELIVATAAHLLGGQADLWLTEAFRRLPGLEELPASVTLPPSELMRSALETHALARGGAAENKAQALAVAAPLLVNGAALGVLQVERPAGAPLSEPQIELLKGLAVQSAIGLQAAFQVNVERWRVEQLSLVHLVSAQVANVLDLDDLFRRVADRVLDTFKYYYVGLFTWEPGQEILRFRASAGPLRTQPEAERDRGAVLHVRLGEGIIGQVAQTGEEILANDVGREPRYRYTDALPETRSEAALPLKIEQRILGVLDVQSDQPDDFQETDMLVLRALAHNISIAVEGTRLYEAVQEQARIASILLHVAEATRSLTTLEQVLETVVRLLPALVGVGRCAVLLSQKEGEPWAEPAAAFVPAAVYGFSESQQAFLDQWRVTPGEAPAFDHLRLLKTPIVIQDAAHDARLPQGIGPALGFESLLMLPLLVRGEVLGALLVDEWGHRPEFEQERLAMMQGIAHQTATAIENVRLLEARQEEAYVSAALLQVAQAVVSFSDLDDILGAIVRITPMLVGVEWCVVFLWDPERDVFWPAQAYGLPQGVAADAAYRPPAARRYAPGDFPLLDAVRECAEWVALDLFSEWEDAVLSGLADDFVAHLRSARERRTPYPARRETHALLAIPLAVKGDVLGVMLLEQSGLGDRFRQRRLEIIGAIAQQAALAVQNDRLEREMAERERLEQELQLAREIQQTFMPSQVPHLPGWDIAFLWRSARQVAGDFYDFFELPNGRLGLVIADVADKGMPAALLMTLSRTLVRAAALEEDSPAAVLARVNDLLAADVQHGMFVTAIYAVLSLETGQLTYANAGHLAPLVWRPSTCSLEPLGKGGMALGVLEGIHVEEGVVGLGPGDYVVFYTDGISEAFSPQADIYGQERLEAAIRTADGGSAQAMLEAIDGSVSAFVGDYPASDDLTLMVLRRLIA